MEVGKRVGSFISISVDTAGSTQIKERICALTKKDKKHRNYQFSEFARMQAIRDYSFFGGVFQNDVEAIKRFFVIKNLGDEFWASYVVNRKKRTHEMNRRFWNLYSATQHILVTPDFRITNMYFEDIDARGDMIEPPATLKSERWAYPAKIYFDLVEDSTDTCLMKSEEFDRLKSMFFHKELQGVEYHKYYSKLANNLNARNVLLRGKKIINISRSDLVGYEVDRFFRVTHAATAGVVTIGNNLFDALKIENRQEIAPGILTRIHLQVPREKCLDSHYLYAIRKDIPKRSMKGIGENYSVYHLLTKRNFDLVHRHHEPYLKLVKSAKGAIKWYNKHDLSLMDNDGYLP